MASDDRSARPGDLVLLVYLEREPREQGCGSGRAEKGRRRSHEKGASHKLLREAPVKHHWAPLCWPLALGCRLLWGLVRARGQPVCGTRTCRQVHGEAASGVHLTVWRLSFATCAPGFLQPLQELRVPPSNTFFKCLVGGRVHRGKRR